MMTSIPRRDFMKTTAGSIAGLSAWTGLNPFAAQAQSLQKPNIIFILADDLGYGDLGCYGQKQIDTPNIDRLAKEGLRFTQCYAGSTVCAPSRCSLMTGHHTGHCRVRGNKLVPLESDDITVAEVLKSAGYVTGIVGKWGLGEPETSGIPTKQGFDEWFGYLNQQHAHNYYPDYLWKNEEKVELNSEYSHDLFTAEAMEFIRRHKTHPFFLYLTYTIPHANNEKGDQGMEVPSDEAYTGMPWPQQEKNFASMIDRMDKDIGKLLDLLKELGLESSTMVVFTSDNGPHREGGHDPYFFDSNGPLKGIKRDLYEGGIRVPAIIRWPGKVRGNAVSDRVWAFWDFLPTAAELAGAECPQGIDGISIVPELLGGQQQDHDYLYWEFHERGFDRAVRMGEWKTVVRGKNENKLELYNLKSDIGEENDIAESHPDIVAKIEAILKTCRTENENWPVDR